MSKKSVTRYLVTLAGIVILAVGYFVSTIINTPSVGLNQDIESSIKPTTYSILLGNQKLAVEIMRTLEEQNQGLSGRESLPEDRGMLFVYTKPGIQHFWMKDMLFPIDIIWINEGKIVAITNDIPIPDQDTPISQLPTYASPQPVSAVLEVNAGYTKKHNIAIGDAVELTNFEPNI